MNIKRFLLIGCLIIPGMLAVAQQPSPVGPDGNITGKVVETMDTGNYTYVHVDAGGKKVWAATTKMAVKVGDSVTFSASDPMQGYHSKTLNRDFDLVYFTGSISVNGVGASAPAPVLPPGHPPLTGTPAPVLPPGHPSLDGQGAGPAPDLTLTGIKPADGGKTIEKIFADASTLAGKPVAVRGKVVKYNANILGKNWLHIRDGSGDPGKDNYDLAVTTPDTAKLGDVVLVTGIVSTNKDFGYNYKFNVMLDGAHVSVEAPH